MVANLRAIEAEVASHLHEARTLATRFRHEVRSCPLEALFLHQPTRSKLLNSRSSLDVAEEFLAEAQSSERMQVGLSYVDKHGFAEHVLRREPTHEQSEGQKIRSRVEQALQLIRRKQAACDLSLKALGDARVAIERSCRDLLKLVTQSYQLELIGQNDTGDLDLVLRFVLDEPNCEGARPRSSIEQQRQGRVLALLRGKDSRRTIDEMISSYLAVLVENAPSVVAARKSSALQNAGRERNQYNELRYREAQEARYSSISRAIAALHFAFACEQHRDVGRMTSETRQAFEKRLADASAQQLEEAFREILSKGILTEPDCALLRYQQRLWHAFLVVSSPESP